MKARFPRLGWRTALVLTHRWMGIAGCLFFMVWFASGIVMMYARMPILANEERLARAQVIDLSSLRVTPAEAAATAEAAGGRFSLVMLDNRPAYRFGNGGARTGAVIVFGDTGERRVAVDAETARHAARRYAPEYSGPVLDHGFLTEPDQWTLQARTQLPAFRFALDDDAQTQLYVSQRSGEVILRTTARERFWGYLGPVMHWLYFTPLRRDGSLWSDVVIWASIAGCVVCITGIVWGLMRLSPSRRFRLAGTPQMSPYSGTMKWHHYTGLVFGVITLTWTFSGLLSMGPGNFLSSRDLGAVRQRLSAAKSDYAALSIERIRAAATSLAAHVTVKELELMDIDGRQYWYAADAPPANAASSWVESTLGPRRTLPVIEHRYADVADPEHVFRTFDRHVLRRVADRAMPDIPVTNATWLTERDAYYYDARGQRPLPVLKMEYGDAARTWLYLDPSRGGVTLAHDRTTRTRRWLYQGLHSLDFPALYDKRPLWDVVVIVLSTGGLAVGVTILLPAWRRVRRKLTRLR